MKFHLIASMLVGALVISSEAQGADSNTTDYKSPLVLLPPIEWTGADVHSPKVRGYFNIVLSPRERQVYLHVVMNMPKARAYFHGVMETSGFFLLKYWDRTPENEQKYSDHRLCAEHNRNQDWPISSWFLNPSRISVAAALIRFTFPFACDQFKGMGNGGWEAIDLGSRHEWWNYSAAERRFYVGAYIETAIEMNVLTRLTDDFDGLVQCMNTKGLDDVLQKLKKTAFETQYPTPWTVSKAVESVCKS